MDEEILECPHCREPSGIVGCFDNCGSQTCRKCSEAIHVFVDEDMDCNYWFGAEKDDIPSLSSPAR